MKFRTIVPLESRIKQKISFPKMNYKNETHVKTTSPRKSPGLHEKKTSFLALEFTCVIADCKKSLMSVHNNEYDMQSKQLIKDSQQVSCI